MATANPKYTHTVHCFTDKSKRRHFTSKEDAVDYANRLLADGEKCKIYPYKKTSRIDYIANHPEEFK